MLVVITNSIWLEEQLTQITKQIEVLVKTMNEKYPQIVLLEDENQKYGRI